MLDVIHWYVVRTKPRREDYAQDQLTRRGVETFLPRISEIGRSGWEPVVGPLFPGYLFARVDLASQYTRVVWTPGVRSFVAFGEVPTPVDEGVVDFIQRRCGEEGVIRVVLTFHDGDIVRVRSGPLEGLVGIVEGQVSARRRVQVLMELLQRR
ncbi:MAG: hypothetical protein A3J75_08495, partial [Acidobacteria bacterium RBG_16_68_9]